jgi:hypothetical protein
MGVSDEEIAMVVQVQAISKRQTEDIAARFEERARQMRARVGEKIAEAIVQQSPVDTGTYIMAHAAGAGESGESESRSSHGKIRGRNPAQFKGLALGNLRRSVSAAAIGTSDEIWFRNRAIHAARVEYLGWGGTGPYRVYAMAAARFPAFVADAARELGMTTR